MKKYLPLILTILFIVALGATSIAATKTWVPTAGGDWTVTTNWSGGAVPVAGDDVIIPADQSANITAVPAITLNSLTVNGTCLWAAAATGNTITITTSMTIASGKTLTMGIAGARIVFTLNGTATINGNFAYDAGTIVRNFTVNAVATLIVTSSGRVYDPALSGGSVFILNNGATLKIGNTGGISTRITADATVAINFGGSYQYKSGANYEYNGTSPQVTGNGLTQMMPANVTINNSAGVTFSTPTTISGNLSISSGASVNLSNYTHSVPALYLGGVLQASGTWGGDGSGATNINTTYFAPGSGILYVNTPFPGTTWLGMTSTDWTTVSNWDNGVPTRFANVTINSAGNQPSIGGAAVCNSITINTGATLTITGANTLTVSGSWTNNGTFTANSSIVIFNGAGQTVGTGPYYNLTLSTSGLKTTAGVTVNGVLSIEGSAMLSAAPTYGAAATLQYNTAIDRTVDVEWITPFAATGGVIIANTGKITLNAAKVFNANVPLTLNSGATLADTTFLLTLNGNLINNGATTSGSGGLTIAGTATQSIGAFTTIGTVLMTKTGSTATFTGNVNGGAFTLNGNGGTLNLGPGLTHTFTGVWTRTNGTLQGNSSILNIGGTISGSGSTFTAGTSTVNYNGAAQTISAYTYNNLTLSGSGAKALTIGTIVNGILSIAPTGTATASVGAGLTLTVNQLYLGGIGQTNGTWGSTSSAATHTNNSYFAATTGMLSVTSALPVELTSFTASMQSVNNAILMWSTATEVNNYGFDIERRIVRSSTWAKVGFVAGNGTSNATHNYTYADNDLSAGKYAYRLKQIDNGGAFKYSQSIELEVNLVPATIGLSQNYPNPFNPSTKITFALASTEYAKLVVYNLLGQQLETLFDGIADGQKEYVVTFDASQLASGIYFYKMQTATRTDVRRMMLMK